jgi:deoxyribodipyrimidine photo-lyase
MTDTDLTSLARLDRHTLVERLAVVFPEAAVSESQDEIAAARGLAIRGGREAAVAVLDRIDPEAYARSRNHVAGAVTGLSPWIRHGVVSLAEVRDVALERVARPEQAEKLVSELAWREYWRQVQGALGAGIEADIEPPAAVSRIALHRDSSPRDALPADVRAASTGMRCIDAFVRRLHDTGWLHNHERMWLASWLVHVRGVRWQAGADWFLRHLLDGDPASNHLSWQWVAGTFAAKPYIFNRENLETYTSGVHCSPGGDGAACPLLGHCDVEGTYDDLAARLFVDGGPPGPRPAPTIRPAALFHGSTAGPAARPLVWLTLDAAAETSPAAMAHPGQPRLFVIDPAWLAAERPTLKRLVFLFECLADVRELMIVVGEPRVEVPAAASRLGCGSIVVADTPCPRVRAAAATIGADWPLEVVAWPPLCDRRRVTDLGRFSRFWNKVRGSALRHT